MPQVPVVQDRLDLQTPGVRSRLQSTPNSFGAAATQAAGDLAVTVNKTTDAWMDKQAENEAKELDNRLSALIREQLYNPESGYLTSQRGENAVKGREQYTERLRTGAEEIASQARNGNSQRLFRDVASRRLNEAMTNIYRHADEQNDVYEDGLSEARINEFRNNAAASYMDPNAVRGHINGALAEVETMGRRRGLGAEVIAERSRAVQSSILAGNVRRMAKDDPTQAEAIFQSVRGAMTATDVQAVENDIREVTLLARATSEVDRIFESYDDNGERLDAARQITDPTLRARVEGAVVERAGRDQLRFQGVEGRALQAYAAGRSIGSLDAEDLRALRTAPEMGAFHARLVDMYEQKARLAASGTTAANNGNAYLMALDLAGRDEAAFFENVYSLMPHMSKSDQEATLKMIASMRAGNGPDAQSQVAADVRNVAAPLLMPYGITLTGRAADDTPLTRQFGQALQLEVQSFLAFSRGRRPNDVETRQMISRTLARLPREVTRSVPSEVRFNDRNAPGLRTARPGAFNMPTRDRIDQGIEPGALVMPADLVPPQEAARIRNRLWNMARTTNPNAPAPTPEAIAAEFHRRAGAVPGEAPRRLRFQYIPEARRNEIVSAIARLNPQLAEQARTDPRARQALQDQVEVYYSNTLEERAPR